MRGDSSKSEWAEFTPPPLVGLKFKFSPPPPSTGISQKIASSTIKKRVGAENYDQPWQTLNKESFGWLVTIMTLRKISLLKIFAAQMLT